MEMLLSFPPEIFVMILEYCDIYALEELRLVSHTILMMVKELMPFEAALETIKYEKTFIDGETNVPIVMKFTEQRYGGLLFGYSSIISEDGKFYKKTRYYDGLEHGIQTSNCNSGVYNNHIYKLLSIKNVYNMGTLVSTKTKHTLKYKSDMSNLFITTSSRNKEYISHINKFLGWGYCANIRYKRYKLNISKDNNEIWFDLRKKTIQQIKYGVLDRRQTVRRSTYEDASITFIIGTEENGELPMRLYVINNKIYIELWIEWLHSYITLSAKLTKKSILKNLFRHD